MKNDLTQFEKELLKSINFYNGTHYDYRHLMEWATNKSIVEKNIKTGEIVYEALGMFVAINPHKK